MDFNGNVSDQSEDLFSDEDGTGNVEFTSPDARKKSPILTQLQTPILSRQEQEEILDRAIVPKTPLSLIPFISKADGWTSDLETPEIKRDQLPNYSPDVVPDEIDNFNHDVTLTMEPVLTPVNPDRHPESDETTEEVVPATQEQPRRTKRRIKRRIFHKNSTNYSALRENEDSDDSTEENSKIIKKSQSCIEYSKRISLSPIKRTNKLREMQRKWREKNAEQLEKKDSVADEEFDKVWRALEMGERAKPNRQTQGDLKSSLNKKEFEEQIVQQSTLLAEDSSKLETNDIFSPVDLGFDEFDQKDVSFDEKTFVVDDNEGLNTETLDVTLEDEDEEIFQGFSIVDENVSNFFLSKFQHHFEADYGGVSSEKEDFNGFSFAEMENSSTKCQNHQVLLEKYFGITTDEESSGTPEILEELPILPPLIVKVYSEFDTASGKKLFVVVDKIVKAQTILLANEDVVEHSIDQLLLPEAVDTKNTDKNEVKSLVKVQMIEQNDVKNVESNITTENTAEIVPSPEKECDIKVPEFKVPMRVEESAALVNNCENQTNFSFVGFQTGSGKPVKISESALTRAAGIYGEDSLKDYADCLNELSDFKSKIQTNRPKKMANGFKPLLPKPTTAVGKPGQFKSPFDRTGKNFERKPLYSRPSPLQNEVSIKQTFEEVKPKETVRSPTVSSSTVNEDLLDDADHWDEIEDFTQLKILDLPKIENNVAHCGFTTGTGKKVQISEEALSRGRAMYAAAEREADADCTKENVPNEREDTKSSTEIKTPGIDDSHKDTDNLINSAKRKNFNDEVTPFGRKRAKIGASDLQGRVLFSEIEEEDWELMQSAITETESVNDRVLPFKKSVAEEFKKTTFLNSFDRPSVFNGRRSDCSNVSVSHKNKAEKRPHSFPDSLKEKKKSVNDNLSQDETIPDDLVFDSQEFLDSYAKIAAKLKPNDEMMRERKEAIKKQEEIIARKRTIIEKRGPGTLYKCRKENNKRIKLQELCYPGKPPVSCSSRELINKGIDSSILSINPSTAEFHKFNLPEFYRNSENSYAEGILLGDGATLIPDENNKAGIFEFKRSFLASPGVDPVLVPRGWIENHYKWIIWKLASMDRVKFSKITVKRSLTPDQVLKQLKYRYDREIDNSERPIIRRILEKDEAPSNRMILAVSKIIKLNTNERINFSIELTDGWYSIMATLDTAMINYIHAGKITEGMKLMIYGAQLLNLEEGCHPLEISDSVRLKIHTNSTRRVKWFTKLGLQKCNGPMELRLKDINRSGGLIGKVTAVVSRVYPILYKETFPNGEVVFRNARSEERAQLLLTRERESREGSKIFRDVTPCFKIRITGDESTGIVTIWQNAEECSEMFKEGSTISIIHGTAGDKRANELQINATRWTTFDVKKGVSIISYPRRIFTPLSETIMGFNPIYGEFDTVGIIVSIGPAPHGMKNFETVNLAYRNESDEDSFLSVLFWQGVVSYGYADIATVGAIICCFNCEWRRNTYRSIPTAFCSERTIITRNPKQESHLRRPFDELRDRIRSRIDYVDDCAMRIHNEVIRKSGSTPNSFSVTPNRRSDGDTGDFTPKSGNLSIQNRLERLKYYGSAPKLSPINLASSRRVSLNFKSPLTNATRNDPSGSRT